MKDCKAKCACKMASHMSEVSKMIEWKDLHNWYTQLDSFSRENSDKEYARLMEKFYTPTVTSTLGSTKISRSMVLEK